MNLVTTQIKLLKLLSSSLHGSFAADLNWLAHWASWVLLWLLGSELVQKFGAGSLHIEASLVQPWVLSDLANGWALGTIEGEERKDQVLELTREASCVGLVEVKVVLASAEQVVEVLFSSCFLEGEDALNDDEQNDSEGEHVNLSAVVLLSFFDFWGHVGKSAAVALEAVDVLVASEAEISKLEVKFVIDQDVFELKVTVNDSV